MYLLNISNTYNSKEGKCVKSLYSSKYQPILDILQMYMYLVVSLHIRQNGRHKINFYEILNIKLLNNICNCIAPYIQ
jgi:hypothetical protein